MVTYGAVRVNKAVVPYSPLAYSQRLIKLKETLPVRAPLPIQLPTDWGEILFSAPPANPDPVAPQLILFMEILSGPDNRSPLAKIVKFTLLFGPVLDLQEMMICPGVELILGVSSGLRLPTSNVIIVESNSSFDKFLTSVLMFS